MNPLLNTDSYKIAHWEQYPPGTNRVYSYLESRGGRFPETVFFGLQYILRKYLAGPVITQSDLGEAHQLLQMHFGKDLLNTKGWQHIITDHRGYLPIKIKAVPEGTVVPTHNVLMTVENTCPQCYWLTNYVESLLVQVWYPTTVATQSRAVRQLIKGALERTGDPAGLDFKLHDFGFRGVSSVESASIGGGAHLASGFKGTDTLVALQWLRRYYDEACAGFSIPASEHSTITSWGRENEVRACENMLDKYPTGLVACVSDSYDIFKSCSEIWGGVLKDKVLNRDGCLVVRPDSGDPPVIVMAVLERLGAALGMTYNEKGFKVLNPKVRVIQGDGVNLDSIAEILRRMRENGWSADNVAFGMGGALLQKLDRDTQKFAFKCAHITGSSFDQASWEAGRVMPAGNAVAWERDVYKDPITDGGKVSKRGRMKLVRKENGRLYTQPEALSLAETDQLVEVFRDGRMLTQTTLAEVRERSNGGV